MRVTVENIRLQYNEQGKAEIVLTTDSRMVDISKEKDLISKGKQLIADIKQYRRPRSLDSNAYMWVLLSKMADVLHTTKDELYLEVLARYGVFTHIIVKPEVVDRVKEEWRTVRELGEVTVNGKTGIQLQCYFGSSTYSTKEMATLIDGVVSECKELGIEVLPPYELQRLKEEWGNAVPKTETTQT
jgi:phosphoribosylaminoimidazole (AIR) synthetase